MRIDCVELNSFMNKQKGRLPNRTLYAVVAVVSHAPCTLVTQDHLLNSLDKPIRRVLLALLFIVGPLDVG
jgi:hypothetical protein